MYSFVHSMQTDLEYHSQNGKMSDGNAKVNIILPTQYVFKSKVTNYTILK